MNMRAADRFWPIVITLMATDFIASLEASMMYGALPTISRDFGDFAAAGWLVSSFVLVQAAAAAIGGRLGDIFGRRRVLHWALAISAAGSAISALSAPIEMVILGRCLQGVSGAILPLSFGIIRENTTRDRSAFGTGLVVGAYSVSGALGFVLGGYFADIGEWRHIFFVTAALPLAAMAAVHLLIPRSEVDRAASRDVDYIGAFALAPAVAGILLGFTVSRQNGLLSPLTLGLILGGAAILLFWIWHELRRPNPLIHLRRLQDRRVLLGITAFLLLGIGPLQMALILLAVMQQPVWTGIGLGLSGAVAGLAKLPGNVAGVFAGPIAGKIAGRFQSRTAAITGYGVLVVAWSIVLFADASFAAFMFGAVLCNVGVTMAMVSTPTLLMEATPKSETSESTGFAYLVRAIGMGIGAQVVSMILAASTVTAPGSSEIYPSAAAFERAIAFVLALSIAGLVLTLAIPRKARTPLGVDVQGSTVGA